MNDTHLDRTEDVFMLTMNADENRSNTSFVRAFAAALDDIEVSTDSAALAIRSVDYC